MRQHPPQTRRVDDPTPQEIHDRCRKIRERWTEATRRRRSGEITRRWTVPEAQDPTWYGLPHMPRL